MKRRKYLFFAIISMFMGLAFLPNCGGGGGGGGSAPAPPADTTAPSTPANLAAAAILSSQVNLTWDVATDNVAVTGYRVYRDGVLIASPATNSYSDTGLNPNTPYSYTVSARDAAGNESPVSTAAAATTPFRTRQLGTSANDIPFGVAADPSGNVLIAGYTEGGLFGTNQGGRDVFLAKYDSLKGFVWGVQSGTASFESAHGVAADASGNVYIAGYSQGTLDGEANAGGSDALLVKYNSAGTRQWTKLLGTAAEDQAWAVCTDASGNVYIAGYTNGSLGGANSGASDIFLAKYDSAGTQLWGGARQIGTAGEDKANGVAVDGSGNVYITGYTEGNLGGEANSGGRDAFLAKYDSAGTLLWVRLLGTSSADTGWGVAVDGSGNAYLTGETNGALGGANQGGRDLFLAMYNSAGVQQWVRQMGTVGEDIGYGVALDGSANAYVTGGTTGGLNGNPNQGDYDIFVASYNSSGTLQWVTQTGTTAEDVGAGIAFDSVGNGAYVTGNTRGSLDGNTNPAPGLSDVVLLKTTPAGVLQ